MRSDPPPSGRHREEPAPRGLRALLCPPLPRSLPARVSTLALFFVGAALALVFVRSMYGTTELVVVAAVVTALRVVADLQHRARPALRVAGLLAGAALAPLVALLAYAALAWGTLLAWTVPWWAKLLVSALAGAAVVTGRPSWRHARVPFLLPLGAWITLCLAGWRIQELYARCDDYLEAVAHPAVDVVLPTTPALRDCRPGETIEIGRYPRVVWELPDRERLVVTTQPALPLDGEGHPDGPLSGAICEWRIGSPAARCFGEGKAQGIVEDAARDRLLVASWGRWPRPGGGQPHRGKLYELPLSGPFEPRAIAMQDGSVGELIYDPEDEHAYGITDEGGELVPIHVDTLRAEPEVRAPIFGAGAVRYDAARHEGLLCTSGGPVSRIDGRLFMLPAVRGAPLRLRALGADTPLAWITMTWGCDWDPAGRRAYMNVPNLGLTAVLDYDSGALLQTAFTGFGMRAITFDPARRRLYLANFLGGFVAAIDASSLQELERWPVGRYPRMVALSRDGRSLFVGTNIGVVTIALEP
ncbi:YncE family protein [Sandaracinus amylolyticus]|uniref:YncE family protein n=1 Tax=Sandaracinus amylolyticus TaxID=927083 RepID=UPI001F1F6613|nr:hypothetical protein [Sandaracinus amylolyticus]UJR84384.1 Hypothetical protein I5071_64630 [Sandaracinus amylolyticus]